ncbi:unnamed protein product [Schistocephalus solidus]|uniref:Uncharacterized protein n=1 Tax=Schistocephalus solidus TaxID=70667 RepID=A0A3P7CLK2_SCHSO|nr:unnamed protein product [Schistocephalus solidus]
MYKVGLCISLWDIVSIGDKFISHDTGAYNIAVTFRMICFRPTVDEIITGSVKNCSRDANIFYSDHSEVTMNNNRGFGNMRTRVNQRNCGLKKMTQLGKFRNGFFQRQPSLSLSLSLSLFLSS